MISKISSADNVGTDRKNETYIGTRLLSYKYGRFVDCCDRGFETITRTN